MARLPVAVSRNGTNPPQEYQGVVRKYLCGKGLRRFICPWVDETRTSKSGIKTAFLGATSIRDGRRFWRTYVERI